MTERYRSLTLNNASFPVCCWQVTKYCGEHVQTSPAEKGLRQEFGLCRAATVPATKPSQHGLLGSACNRSRVCVVQSLSQPPNPPSMASWDQCVTGQGGVLVSQPPNPPSMVSWDQRVTGQGGVLVSQPPNPTSMVSWVSWDQRVTGQGGVSIPATKPSQHGLLGSACNRSRGC